MRRFWGIKSVNDNNYIKYPKSLREICVFDEQDIKICIKDANIIVEMPIKIWYNQSAKILFGFLLSSWGGAGGDLRGSATPSGACRSKGFGF